MLNPNVALFTVAESRRGVTSFHPLDVTGYFDSPPVSTVISDFRRIIIFIRLLCFHEVSFSSWTCQEKWYHETALRQLTFSRARRAQSTRRYHLVVPQKGLGLRVNVERELRCPARGMRKSNFFASTIMWGSDGGKTLYSMPSSSPVSFSCLSRTIYLHQLCCVTMPELFFEKPIEAMGRLRISYGDQTRA
jgi:hypothetical protein